MKNWLINFASNRVIGPLWNFLDGKKTAFAAAGAILAGLTGLGTELAPLVAAHNTAAIIELVKHLSSNPSWLLILTGAGAFGLGKKIDKNTAAVEAAAPVMAPVKVTE